MVRNGLLALVKVYVLRVYVCQFNLLPLGEQQQGSIMAKPGASIYIHNRYHTVRTGRYIM